MARKKSRKEKRLDAKLRKLEEELSSSSSDGEGEQGPSSSGQASAVLAARLRGTAGEDGGQESCDEEEGSDAAGSGSASSGKGEGEEGEEGEEDSGSQGEDGEGAGARDGMADVMAKILGQEVAKKVRCCPCAVLVVVTVVVGCRIFDPSGQVQPPLLPPPPAQPTPPQIQNP